MTEYKNIRVKPDAYERAKKSKRDNETWSDFIRRLSNEPAVEMSEEDVRRIVRDELEEYAHR